MIIAFFDSYPQKAIALPTSLTAIAPHIPKQRSHLPTSQNSDRTSPHPQNSDTYGELPLTHSPHPQKQRSPEMRKVQSDRNNSVNYSENC
ncbi:hypothetical protein PN471_20075 [Aphanizomenon sp. CS-733/32]|uniref:hypothetical protein n=1 Tax=Aphanizomenon sp. CS-733/32 TaxID=3021715 RepID=UPI00232C7758|nr:hypothetical protein [Aphanizomenon sp. CS-733/32]MDB9310880.1 hypothetical protein [Aphanizomenon sp. CS-733/32]